MKSRNAPNVAPNWKNGNQSTDRSLRPGAKPSVQLTISAMMMAAIDTTDAAM